MQALIEMSRYQYHILPEYEISYEHLSQYGFRDIKVCPLTRRRAQQELNEQKSIIEHLDAYYDQFKGWAESFDAATMRKKKMSICKLISRIEVGRGYKVNIILNMDYGQFVGE